MPASEITERTIASPADVRESDTIIDAGNAYYHDDIRYAGRRRHRRTGGGRTRV